MPICLDHQNAQNNAHRTAYYSLFWAIGPLFWALLEVQVRFQKQLATKRRSVSWNGAVRRLRRGATQSCQKNMPQVVVGIPRGFKVPIDLYCALIWWHSELIKGNWVVLVYTFTKDFWKLRVRASLQPKPRLCP